MTEDISYAYDHAERLDSVGHSLDGGPYVTLLKNSYDELGRLSSTVRGGSDTLSSEYQYNVRSWLKSISGAQFHETIHYEDQRTSIGPTSPVRYDGSISSIEWTVPLHSSMRLYDFTYDGLGRLTRADYGENRAIVCGYGAFPSGISGEAVVERSIPERQRGGDSSVP